MAKKVSVICPCFRGENYLGPFLDNVASQTMLHDLELVLDHNEPSDKELSLVHAFDREFPGVLVHSIVSPVEPIGRSMNNCINAASGEYLCLWNVDDHRTENSLERMCSTLDRHSDAGFTYGDFVIVDALGNRKGRPVTCIEFDRSEFTRSMILGPFFMWRASLTPTVGLFDEQFKSGADFDLAIRLAMSSSGRKTKGNLGYYLSIGQGASSGGSHVPTNIQPIERTVIELRYGIYDKIDYGHIPHAARYNIPYLLQLGHWVHVEQFVPEYEKFISERHNRWFALGLNSHFHRRSLQPSLVARAIRRISLIFITARERIGR